MFDPLRFEKIEMRSGITLHHQYRDLPWFSAIFLIDVGHLLDPVGKEGTAHLLEHYMTSGGFGDLPAMSDADLHQWIERREFLCNLGQTGMHEMRFSGRIDNDRAEILLRFLTDVVLRPRFESDLEHDRAIVRAERLHRRTPESLKKQAAYHAAVYGSHRFATATGGPSDEILNAITHDDLIAFHRRYFGPPNMHVLIIGGLETDRAARLIDTFANDVVSCERIAPYPPIVFAKAVPAEHLWEKTGDSQGFSATVRCRWHLPPEPPFATVLLRNALGHLMHDRLREREKITYHADCGADFYPDHRVLQIKTTVAPGDVTRVRCLIAETMADEAAIRQAVEETKRTMGYSVRLSDDTVGQMLSTAASYLTDFGRIFSISETLRVYANSDAHRIAKAATALTPEASYVSIDHD